MESEQTRRIASESTTHYREFLELSRRVDALESSASRPPADAGKEWTHRLRKDDGTRYKSLTMNTWYGTDDRIHERMLGGKAGNTDLDLIPIAPSPPPAAEQDDVVRRRDVLKAINVWRYNMVSKSVDSLIADIPSAPSHEQIVAETVAKVATTVDQMGVEWSIDSADEERHKRKLRLFDMSDAAKKIADAIRALSPASKPRPTFADGVAAAREAVEQVLRERGPYAIGNGAIDRILLLIDSIKEPTT